MDDFWLNYSASVPDDYEFEVNHTYVQYGRDHLGPTGTFDILLDPWGLEHSPSDTIYLRSSSSFIDLDATMFSVTDSYGLYAAAYIRVPGASQWTYAGSTSVTLIPEPGSIFLFGSGLIGLAHTVRRRMRSFSR